MSKAMIKVDGSKALVNAKSLNRVYDDLMMLAYEAGYMVEVCDRMTLRALQIKIKGVCFEYAKCYGELNRLILEKKE